MKKIKQKLIIFAVSTLASFASLAFASDLNKDDIRKELTLSLAVESTLISASETNAELVEMLANANLKSQAGIYLSLANKPISSAELFEAEE